jgi:hypothetical protein
VKTALLLSAVVFCGLSADQDLATRYAAQKALRVETTTKLALEVTAMQMTRDGEPVEGRGGAGGGSSSTHRSVVIDRYLEVAGDRPAKVQRGFEELEGESTATFGGEERSQALESDFDGLLIELTQDESGEVSVEVVEGSGPDSEVLAKLTPELALDALLPKDPAAEEATWTLDAPALRRALGFEIPLFKRPEPEEGGGQGGGRRGGFGRRGPPVEQQLATAEWSGKATFKGLEDFEGTSCGVIALEIGAEGESDDGEGSVSSFEAKLEGHLYVDVANRRPLALVLEGTLSTESDTVREREGSTMEIHRASQGTLEHRVKVAETAFERE